MSEGGDKGCDEESRMEIMQEDEETKNAKTRQRKKRKNKNTSELIILKLLSDPKLLRDRAGMERLQAVYSKMGELLSGYRETIDQHFSWYLNDKVYSVLISHALKYISSNDSSPVGVIRYQGPQYNSSGEKFDVLPTSEIMKLVDEKIAAGSSEGMDKIYIKTGHLVVPSFCVSNQNQKIEKLERRKTRLNEFRKICNEMLLLSNDAETPSPSTDSTLFAWEGNYIQNIKFLDPIKKNKKPKDTARKHSSESVDYTEINSTLKEPENEGKNEQVFGAEEVSKIIVDMYSSRVHDNAQTAGAALENKDETMECTPNVHEHPVSEAISSNISQDHHTNADDLTNEEKEAEKRKLKNWQRNNRRRAKRRSQYEKETNISSTEANPDHAAPLLRESTTVPSTGIPTECVKPNIVSARLESPDSQHVTSKLLPDLNPNPARLERDAHYVCWFDKSDGAFCYRKLLRTFRTGETLRHRPYHSFKTNPSDTENSPVIKIEFVLLQTLNKRTNKQTDKLTDKRRLEQYLTEMRKTCVANTLPPGTNELPPWNPIYENLYIMEVMLNEQHDNHWSSKVVIWKYPTRQISKFSMRIRSG